MEKTAKKIQVKIRLYTLFSVVFTAIMIAGIALFSLREELPDLQVNHLEFFQMLREFALTTGSVIILIVLLFAVGLHFLMKPLSDQLLLGQDEFEDLLEKNQKKLKNSNEKLLQLAMHDSLTDIFNRRAFHERFERELTRCNKFNLSCALFFLDVDNFKKINDDHGHAAGDFLLIQLSQALLNVVRRDDMVARIGGDEFVILVPKKTDKIFILDMLSRLEKLIAVPVEYENKKILYKISIGVSICPRDGETMDELLKNADKKMYRNKSIKKLHI